MNVQASGKQPVVSYATNRSLAAILVILILAGLFMASSAEQLIGYLAVVFAAVLPGIVWLYVGAPGIPVLPAVGLAYIPYFAWPALIATEDVTGYTPGEVFRAAVTVSIYLLTATAAWKLISGWVRVRPAGTADYTDWPSVVRLMLAGLLVGLLFHIGLIAGWFGWAGVYFGVIRTVASTFAVVACFLMGVTRAKGVLRGRASGAAIVAFSAMIVLSWSSLFLVSGMIYILAVSLGYVIVSRRIPWLALGTVFVAVSVLHAGKAEMRTKYWEQGGNWGGVTSVFELPAFATEWAFTGLEVIAAGKDETSVLERASLLHILLRVQAETPETIPYLGGETYSLLPAILVPRFIDSDKPASQIGMDLLNIQYGILTAEGVAGTAVGWGLVAEAYANFGYFGVVAIALLFGALCGLLMAYSKNAELLSVPSLVSIAFMMGLVNLEADFISLCSSLLQSVAAVLIFYAACRLFVMSRKPEVALEASRGG